MVVVVNTENVCSSFEFVPICLEGIPAYSVAVGKTARRTAMASGRVRSQSARLRARPELCSRQCSNPSINVIALVIADNVSDCRSQWQMTQLQVKSD